MTSNTVLLNLNRKWLLLIFGFNFLILIFFFFFFFFSFEIYTNKKGSYSLTIPLYIIQSTNIILIQYPCFSSTARNLGTKCLNAFRNGVKSVAQSFHTTFIFVYNSSSELNDSPALP